MDETALLFEEIRSILGYPFEVSYNEDKLYNMAVITYGPVYMAVDKRMHPLHEDGKPYIDVRIYKSTIYVGGEPVTDLSKPGADLKDVIRVIREFFYT